MERLRGGRKQRALQHAARTALVNLSSAEASATSAAAAARHRSYLAQELLQMWSWGSLTAAMVQKLALAAVRDGAHCTALDAMGAGGDHVGNAHRDLVRLLQRWCPPTTSAVEMTLPLMRTKHTAGVERVSAVPPASQTIALHAGGAAPKMGGTRAGWHA
jgi:hypothetical protein